MSIIKMNRRIIQVMNSCKYEEFEKLLNDILDLSEYKKYFTSKWYIWNVLRCIFRRSRMVRLIILIKLKS